MTQVQRGVTVAPPQGDIATQGAPFVPVLQGHSPESPMAAQPHFQLRGQEGAWAVCGAGEELSAPITSGHLPGDPPWPPPGLCPSAATAGCDTGQAGAAQLMAAVISISFFFLN